MAGEWNTFNEAIKGLGKHDEREISVTYKSMQKSMEQIQEEMNVVGNFEAMRAAQVEEIMVLGCLALSRYKILRHTEELFERIGFRVLEECWRRRREWTSLDWQCKSGYCRQLNRWEKRGGLGWMYARMDRRTNPE